MTRIEFVVHAIPIAQPRQRHRVIQSGGKAFATNYTPKNDPVNAFKAACQLAASQAYQGPPLDGPLYCELKFVLPRPATKPTWIKREIHWWYDWRLGHSVPHVGKPDRDNLMKSLQDALNGLLFRDDSLLYDGQVSKWIAAEDEQPHVCVVIDALVGEAQAPLSKED